ncbi:MAG: hypothetical protein V3U28_04280 [Candidatus Acidoferrales bacterium]
MAGWRIRFALALLLLLCPAQPAAPQGASPAAVEWAADGRVLIVARGFLARFDLEAGEEELLAENVVAFAVSPTGDRLAVAGPGRLELRSYPEFERLATLERPASAPLVSLAWSPDGATLAAGTAEGHILLWDAATLEPWADLGIEPPSAVARLRFSADGARLLTAFADSRAVLWDIEERDVVRRFDWPRPGAAGENQSAVVTSFVDLSPDGRHVLANRTLGGDSKVVLLNDRGRVRWSREGYGIEFTPDGSGVLSLVPPFRVAALYPVEGQARAQRIFQPPGSVTTLFLVRASPDQEFLVGVGEDEQGEMLILWDFATARVLATQR